MKNKGITLVTLVITIIVMLILAGVAMNLTLNSEGLFGKATGSANKWNDAVVNEQTEFQNISDKIDEYSEKNYEYLSKCGAVGDFVNYDAGNWESGEANSFPTEANTFGGGALGQSRNLSLSYTNERNITYKCQYNGWRILNIDNNGTVEDYSDDIVTLIHAGFPEYFKMGDNSYDAAKILNMYSSQEQYPSSIQTHDFSYYVNSKYATNATIWSVYSVRITTGVKLPAVGANKINSSIVPNDLIIIGRAYTLSTPKHEPNTTELWSIDDKGYCMAETTSSTLRSGIRPIITLKPGVEVLEEKVTDTLNENNTNGMWKLK